MPQLHISSVEQLPEVARTFLQAIPAESRIIAFYGEMGVGKTTFIKALCKELGVSDTVNSPTFSIVNEYDTDKGDQVYHFDFYRIQSPQEALDFGVYDYFDSGNYCFLEWADKIEALLPPETLLVHITEDIDGSRTLRF